MKSRPTHLSTMQASKQRLHNRKAWLNSLRTHFLVVGFILMKTPLSLGFIVKPRQRANIADQRPGRSVSLETLRPVIAM